MRICNKEGTPIKNKIYALLNYLVILIINKELLLSSPKNR